MQQPSVPTTNGSIKQRFGTNGFYGWKKHLESSKKIRVLSSLQLSFKLYLYNTFRLSEILQFYGLPCGWTSRWEVKLQLHQRGRAG